jgi:hypothetical protein
MLFDYEFITFMKTEIRLFLIHILRDYFRLLDNLMNKDN